MIIETPIGTYLWHEDWAKIPDTPSGKENGRTHGIVVAKNGDVIVFHQATPSVLIYDQNGKLKNSWGDFHGAHGLTLIEENGDEFLWLTDQESSRVVKTTVSGEIVQELPKPQNSVYSDGSKPYVPTWAVQNPITGEVWVGDGYGAWLVHCFSSSGEHLMTLDGTEGAGQFREPHGLNITQGKDGLELFITDRSHHRIVVYDTEGHFLRSSQVAHSPCSFDFLGEQVLVAELFTGVKILNKYSLEVLAEIGANPQVAPNENPDNWWPPLAPSDWPNLAGTDFIHAGIFNSPHDAAFAANGDIYVAEWIIGGRITKLERLT